MDLRKVLSMAAIGALALTPKAAKAAQTNNQAEQPQRPSSIVQTENRVNWQWQGGSESLREQAVYDSLPKEYKAFANKNFVQRAEMRETWEQKDYLRRDRARKRAMEGDPNAPQGETFSFDYETHIESEVNNGTLTPEQGIMAKQLATLGRPLSTIDPKLPYAEQLKLCGFTQSAKIADGEKEYEMTSKDHSEYVAEQVDVNELNSIGNNANSRREIRNRCRTENEAHEASKKKGLLGFLRSEKTTILSDDQMPKIEFEKLNGKQVRVYTPGQINDSFYDNLTRKVAGQIKQSEMRAAQNGGIDPYNY